MSRYRSVLLLLSAFAGCARGPVPRPPSSPTTLLDKPSPALKRASLDERAVDLGAHVGHVVVLDFFATYCEPCLRALPGLQTLATQRSDLVVIGVDEDESRADAIALRDRLGLRFPIVHDPAQQLAGRFHVRALPATFVLDRRGAVCFYSDGELPPGTLEQAIDACSR